MKSRRITQKEHEERLRYGVCPRCGDYRLVHVVRMSESDKPGGKPKFAGAFWSCGSPLGHECYHLSGENAKALTESADGNDPVKIHEDIPYIRTVIHRKKASK